jgi:hypothetical protein
MGEQYQHSSSRKMMGEFGLDSRGSGQGQMAGFCEHSNELAGCVKSREILHCLWHQQLFKKECATCSQVANTIIPFYVIPFSLRKFPAINTNTENLVIHCSFSILT